MALIAFVIGKPYYVEKPPQGNVFAEFVKATWNGLRNRCKSKDKSKEHFLDYCDERFSRKRLEEFKVFFTYFLSNMY